MMNRDWQIQIQHISRNANKVADYMAKKAIHASLGFHFISSPWAEVTNLMLQDLYLANAG